jgi:aspartate/glutamate racemase
MAYKIVLVHTVPFLINEFNTLGERLLPGVKFFHILDEVILERIHQHGSAHSDDSERLRSYILSAEEIGAQAVLVTCSTLSTLIDDLRSAAGIPVIKIDEALVENAVSQGSRIGLIATNPDTMGPSTQILYDEAARVGKDITVVPVLVEHAFDAIRRGDVETHDRLVKQAVVDTAPGVDVIVLAQASMARVLQQLSEAERRVPVLSSPQLAMERVKQVVANRTNH